jgi:hypothetical protein
VNVEDESKKEGGPFARAHVTLGIDAPTARELWRSSALASWNFTSDVVGDRGYRASRDGDLDVYDVRTGRVLLHVKGHDTPGRVPRQVVQLDDTRTHLFRAYEDEAILVTLATGAVAWRTHLPADAWATLEQTPIDAYSIGADATPLVLALLDRKTGAVKARAPLPPKSSVHADPGGGFYVLGSELAAHDADGSARARLARIDPPNLHAGLDFAALFSNDETAIVDRKDLHRLGSFAGSYGVQDGSSLAQGLLLYRFVERGTKPGEAVVVRRAPRK